MFIFLISLDKVSTSAVMMIIVVVAVSLASNSYSGISTVLLYILNRNVKSGF